MHNSRIFIALSSRRWYLFLISILWSLSLLVVAACSGDPTEGNSSRSQVVTVFAASSLINAFDEVAEAFESQNPDIDIIFNYAGSSQLAVQLREGAAADLFASANKDQLMKVMEDGRIDPNEVAFFASNSLTILVPADNPSRITGIEDLSLPGIQLVLATDGVPVRAYTDQVVSKMPAEFQARFYENVVSEEANVRQAAAKVALGEADAAIVYATDLTPDIGDKVQNIAIDRAQNVTASYVIAPLNDSSIRQAAAQFTEFLVSPEGQKILSRWGFEAPTGLISN